MRIFKCAVCDEIVADPDRHKGEMKHQVLLDVKRMAERGRIPCGGTAALLARIDGLTRQARTGVRVVNGQARAHIGHYAPEWAVRVAEATDLPPALRKKFIETHRKDRDQQNAILAVWVMVGAAGLTSHLREVFDLDADQF